MRRTGLVLVKAERSGSTWVSGPPSANCQILAIQVLGAVEHGVSRGVQHGDSREEKGDNPGTEAEGALLRGRGNRRGERARRGRKLSATEGLGAA